MGELLARKDARLLEESDCWKWSNEYASGLREIQMRVTGCASDRGRSARVSGTKLRAPTRSCTGSRPPTDEYYVGTRWRITYPNGTTRIAGRRATQLADWTLTSANLHRFGDLFARHDSVNVDVCAVSRGGSSAR
jgi:hypothetical protein